jgi:hypothetical protein
MNTRAKLNPSINSKLTYKIREKILEVVEQTEEISWGKLSQLLAELSYDLGEVRLILRSLVVTGNLNVKKAKMPKDWKYSKVSRDFVGAPALAEHKETEGLQKSWPEMVELLEARHTQMLQWPEPLMACGPEGNDLSVSLYASVHDCINMQRRVARLARRSTMGNDAQHLLDFMQSKRAIVVSNPMCR